MGKLTEQQKRWKRYQRDFAAAVGYLTNDLAFAISDLKDITSGGDTFYAEVDGTMYKIAPVAHD